MLLNLEGFQYATSLDLNMGYYHIELSPNSKKLCTLVTPFGKYKMQKLPMGLCNSPNIFQEKVSILMEGLKFVHDVNFEANWQYIKHRKQRMIVQNNKRKNASELPTNTTLATKS
jgi:hypothetical protein